MDLKQFLSRLEEAGDLLRIREPVDAKHEIAAILDAVDKASRRAVLFERVRGHRTQVAGSLLSHRRRIALAMGVEEDALLKEYLRRMKRRLKPKMVAPDAVVDAFVQAKPDILKEVPVLTHREGDAGPYFTSAVTIAKDPETGESGMGIYRVQVRGPDEISLNFQNPPLTRFLQKAEAMGKELEIALVLGMDPLTFIASVFPAPPGTDRYEIAGGLRGSAVELMQCKTVDLRVPADAEFVLEGRVKPRRRVNEGPFGESWGTYQKARNPVARIDAIVRKKAPVYQALLSYSGEDRTLIGFSLEALLLDSLRAAHPGVISVDIDRFNRSHLIVRMKKSSDAEPREVLKKVLASVAIAKTAIVVDDDIDGADPYALGFAMATRFQAKRGTVIVEAAASALDPSAPLKKSGRSSSKLGIDATRPLAAPKELFRMIRMSSEMKERGRQFG